MSWLYAFAASFRRGLYSSGLLKSDGPDCPVVVVGNLSVGGTGKTPLVIWLAEFLARHGWKPGIVSRGYGGRKVAWPRQVRPDSDPREVGDEALLISRRTGCPMAVDPDRVRAARSLREQARCDIILSDDGLQHYALKRDIEIVVVDSTRLFGNGYCLPVGPLREKSSRLKQVDLVVYNGSPGPAGFEMNLIGDVAVNNRSAELKVPLAEFSSSRCHALAGIGNPGRFFDHLKARGLRVDSHSFPDHHAFIAADLCFGDDAPVLMTEKDAVKCAGFSQPNHWHVPVAARLERGFEIRLLQLLEDNLNEQKTA
ncbi:MAG: tetraacyldisaccharide 4'-kinase [Methylococcaceae bacterium]|nr:tetraacyldisaccharide 4'-kinase [Methylococcaceae bacterium]